MQLELWVPPCVLFGWWFSLWELWRVWLVDIVLPMRLQTPSAPSVLSLTPPLGSPCSVQWLAASIHIHLWQSLLGDRYIRLLPARSIPCKTPNPDTISEAKKRLLTTPLLKGSFRFTEKRRRKDRGSPRNSVLPLRVPLLSSHITVDLSFTVDELTSTHHNHLKCTDDYMLSRSS